eukprot:gene9071-16723_t
MAENRGRYPCYLHISLVLLSSILGSFGTLGYLRYGDETNQIVTENLEGSLIVIALRCLLFFGVLFTYPLQIYPVIQIVEGIIFGPNSRCSRRLYRKGSTVNGGYDDSSNSDNLDDEDEEYDHAPVQRGKLSKWIIAKDVAFIIFGVVGGGMGLAVTISEDKTLKGTVYRISGSVPAGNYIQFPKTTSQSLGLTGHYVYFLFKPIVTKYFVVHLDVATEDGIIVRISFSNLFKEFKSTSTWLQFPFISTPPPGSVEEATTHKLPLSSKVGTAPVTSRWTLFCMDLHYVLSVYLNRKYAYLKSLRLCANMMVKNVFTSDTNYQPGISMKVARKTGLLETGFIPLPREMSFPSENFEDWKKRYDYVKFPAEDGSKSFRDVIPGKARSPMQARKSTLGTISPGPIDNISQQISRDAGRRYSAKNYSKQAVKSRVALVDRLVAEKVSMKPVTGTLPELGIKTFEDEIADQNAVHIFAGQNERLHSHEHERNIEKGKSRNRAKEEGTERISDHIGYPSQSSLQSLQPDPILALDKMIGVAGGTMKNVSFPVIFSQLGLLTMLREKYFTHTIHSCIKYEPVTVR